MIKSTAIVAALAALGGCAVLPDTVRPELEHMSHATQHRPFTSTPTRYGANMANLVVRWDLPKRFTLELAEGVSLDKHYPDIPAYGELIGPREQFSARIGYSFRVPK
jgi:hypothetical protein